MLVLSTLSSDKKRRIPGIARSLLEPIGELTANFAMLEQTLKSGIELVLFPFDRLESLIADVVTAELSFRRHAELLQCLFDLRAENDSERETLRELCKAALQLEEQRNVIMHSYWGFNPQSKGAVRLKTTAKAKGLRRQSQAMTHDEIADIANEMGELAKTLEDFFQEVEPVDEQLMEYFRNTIDRYQGYLDSYERQSKGTPSPDD